MAEVERRYDLRSMDATSAEGLLRRTYAAEARLYPDVEPFDVYAARLAGPELASCEVATLERPDGEVLAYSFQFAWWVEVAGRRGLIVRGNLGVLPAVAGRKFGTKAQVWGLLRTRLRYPTTPMWSHIWVVSHASYVCIARVVPEVCPHPDHPTSPEIDDLARHLAARFGGGGDPWHEHFPGGGVRTRPSDTADDDCVRLARFYDDANPGHADGWALGALFPVTFGVAARSVVLTALLALRGWARRIRPALGRPARAR